MSKLLKLSTGALVAVLFAAPVYALANNGSGYAPRSVGSTLEVSIADNGKTVVRGAKVTDVSGSTITAQTIWGVSSITWTVRTDSSTDFIERSGSGSGIAEISDGDYVSFSGMLHSGTSFTVDADVVKNWSVSQERAVIVGTVTDIDGGDLTVRTAAHGTVTVRVTGSTAFEGSADALGDLTHDMRIVARGSYNADTKVLSATEIRTNERFKADDHGKRWGKLLDKFKFGFWNR